jgi:hypothetical protein
LSTQNFNINNSEKYEKKKFEGITKMNKNFSKFNNKEENMDNSSCRNNRKSLEKDKNSLSFFENRNNNMRSVSPITHKKDHYIESYKLLETKYEKRNTNNGEGNISYFEEFNVKKILFKKIRKKIMTIVLVKLEKNLRQGFKWQIKLLNL